MTEKSFKFIMPAELSKSADGEWVVQGLASTGSKDQQGEIILPEGIDASPIDAGKAVFNWDHQKGPESILGLLDSYSKTKEGFFVRGRLFKNHTKAKAVYEIMSSLGKSDSGKIGLSVEGSVLERAGADGKIIKKCRINAVALTMNPVNQDSYVDLVKSLSSSEIDFQATEENSLQSSAPTSNLMFTSEQVVQLIQKALGGGGEAITSTTPGERTQGAALSPESSKPKKRMKKMSKDLYKSNMVQLLDKIQKLYPDNSRTELWSAIKVRLQTRFPSSENDG